MYVTAARGTKAAKSKTNFRDKPCGIPKLLVDLLRGVTETRPRSAAALLEPAIETSNAN